ncbi:MAG: cyclic nucleotide-binding domain-containing protein [Gammaproteobacteria bacterium]|nr:cyclic nucleotide-binding domain-containing protein [Gammaproteobacteria bacterium]
MFFNEAQTAGMLRHPNITSIYDAGMDQDIFYIVMEYVHEGQTLERFTRSSSLFSLEDTTNILYQCTLGLDYAHRRGVIHRDIKPRNILITPSKEAKVSDFGVAIVQSKVGEIAPDLAGSPLYMSPEKIRHEPLTGQSDLFSLGIVAFELLTGQHPFTGGNLEAINHQTLTKRAPALANYRADIPDIYQRIIDKALAKAPYYRYKSGSDLAGDIALVFDFLRVSPQQISPQEKFSKAHGLRFFADFHEPELWEIINAAEWLELPVDREIISEGEFDPSFFVIVDGSVDVIKNGRAIVQLSAGDCFGEMGLTTGRRRSATIRAKQTVHVLKIRSSIIDRTSVNCQLRFQRNFLNALIERLELATDQLANKEPENPAAE